MGEHLSKLWDHDSRALGPAEPRWHPYWIPAAHCLASPPRVEYFSPPVELRGSVAFFWTLGCSGLAESIAELMAPAGDADLIYCLEGAGQTLVRGPQRRLTSISIDPSARYIGVRLEAGAAQRLTGLAASELLDRRLPAAPISSELADLLHEPTAAHESARFLAALVSLLRQQLPGCGNPAGLGLASRAMDVIRRSSGTSPVRDIARRLGCSERHLRRTMVAATGLAPKEYARIVRFQHAMHLVVRTPRPLAEIALELAYTDQAHMTRDFIALAERTPFALRRTMSVFDKKSAVPQG
jgi:AraC-like DNA-binding protein